MESGYEGVKFNKMTVSQMWGAINGGFNEKRCTSFIIPLTLPPNNNP